MTRAYIPISCSVHDELLALATRREECDLTVSSTDSELTRVRGVIVDVYSRAGAEWLELSDGTRFRLDEIVALNGSPIPPP